MTRSPGRTSFAATWSSLCSVATPTVEPPTKTGSSWAKGVARPVRPMETWIAMSLVVRSSGGNLKAMAHRGALDVAPRTACSARSSTLVTTPSISYARSWRTSASSRQRSKTWVMPLTCRASGLTGNPDRASRAKVSVCVAAGHGDVPSTTPTWYAQKRSGRMAVIFGSFWRSAPAAELRGFTKRRSPASACRLFIASNSATGM